MNDLPDPESILTIDAARTAFSDILDGNCDAGAIKNFLIGLADRGETADEIAAAVSEMRARMIAVDAPDNAIDVCGTGGDGSHSLNISTATALVVAACDVPMAKHGNRAASSKSGAADTLEALGLDLAKAADSEVIILGIQLPPNFGKRYTEPFYNSFASLAKQEDTGYLPFLLDGVAQYQALMQSDGLHPTKEAQPRILENVLPVVKQALDMP